LELVRWCITDAKPFYLHVHDYWPHHRDRVEVLVERYGARLLAITPHIADALASDGFPAALLPVGVAVGVPRPVPIGRAGRPTVGCVGRLVPRKRFTDVVRGFCHAGLGQVADLHLRVPPSLVYPPEQDLARLREIRAAADRCSGTADAVYIDRVARVGTDYSKWSAYVSASEYEGVSMTPIESVLDGCAPLVSDIPPHRALIDTLFPGRADEFLFPVGDYRTLAGLLRDEVHTGRRRADIARRQREIHDHVDKSWSLRITARAMAALANATEPAATDCAR
jgi:glycosyltransferase involved in cell wall biosynthesis